MFLKLVLVYQQASDNWPATVLLTTFLSLLPLSESAFYLHSLYPSWDLFLALSSPAIHFHEPSSP